MKKIDLKDLKVKSFITGPQWILGGRMRGEDDGLDTDGDCCGGPDATCWVICD